LDLKLKSPHKDCPTVFVCSNLKATLTCPNCGKFLRQNISRFFNPEKPVKIKCKCSCQHSFSVRLERKHSKKKEELVHGHIEQYRWITKKNRNYQDAFVLTMFSIMIVVLILTFSLFFYNDVSSKLSPKTDPSTIIQNGEKIIIRYDSIGQQERRG
jgi:hypothetical protein